MLDPKHTSKLCKSYLERKQSAGIMSVMEWPPQSPDLNPIELLGTGRDVRKKCPTSVNHLCAILQEAWSIYDRERRACSIWVHRTDITRLTIDRERWQIKKERKISEEQNIKKKVYDQARGRTRVNIGADFQQWRELKEQEGLEAEVEVALFLLDRRVTLILFRFTQLMHVFF